MNKFLLVYSNYNGHFIEIFKSKEELEHAACNVLLIQNSDDKYGTSLDFAGEIVQEFEFKPVEKVIKYKAVSKDQKNEQKNN